MSGLFFFGHLVSELQGPIFFRKMNTRSRKILQLAILENNEAQRKQLAVDHVSSYSKSFPSVASSHEITSHCIQKILTDEELLNIIGDAEVIFGDENILGNQTNQQIIQVIQNINGSELSHVVEYPLLTDVFTKDLKFAGSNIQFDESDKNFTMGTKKKTRHRKRKMLVPTLS